jgi:hypothetical protein
MILAWYVPNRTANGLQRQVSGNRGVTSRGQRQFVRQKTHARLWQANSVRRLGSSLYTDATESAALSAGVSRHRGATA